MPGTKEEISSKEKASIFAALEQISQLTQQIDQIAERLGRLEAEFMLAQADIIARRIDAESEQTIPLTVARRVFVENLTPIRVIREWRGMTQTELAQRISSSKSYISQLETRNRRPGIQTLQKIAKALNVPMEILLE